MNADAFATLRSENYLCHRSLVFISSFYKLRPTGQKHQILQPAQSLLFFLHEVSTCAYDCAFPTAGPLPALDWSRSPVGSSFVPGSVRASRSRCWSWCWCPLLTLGGEALGGQCQGQPSASWRTAQVAKLCIYITMTSSPSST